jgi:glycosyltransferase involved in cell wall biosynthesis
MILALYSETTRATVRERMGKPEYSYHFVREKFLPVLRDLGAVVEVEDLEAELPALIAQASRERQAAALLFFGPPHRAPDHPGIATVCIFAWEFPTIPAESWDGRRYTDWRVALGDIGNVIVLSTFAAEAVRLAIPEGLHLAVIPAPITQPFSLMDWFRRPLKRAARIEVQGEIYDSRDYRISHEFAERIVADGASALPCWPRQAFEWRVGGSDAARLALVGFYGGDTWGRWSRTPFPWIALPWRIDTPCRVVMELLGVGPNIDREITVELGGDSRTILVGASLQRFELEFHPGDAGNAIRFHGVVPTQGGVSAEDSRSLGIGIASMHVEALDASADAAPEAVSATAVTQQRLLDGVVFTSVFNPEDGRKNWEDMVTAFCWTFRDDADATLVLKMSHHDLGTFFGRLVELWSRLHPFRCRVIALHGYLDERAFGLLIDASSYIVNSSHCEGQCLPLMEFMRRGVPAVAPAHTAMRDYIDSENAFVVASSPSPTCWPHDPRYAYRTTFYRLDWQSLCDGLRAAADCARREPKRYRRMAARARRRIARDFGPASVRVAMRNFLAQLKPGGQG